MQHQPAPALEQQGPVFYALMLDEVSIMGFYCRRYLSNRNLNAHIETQHSPAPSQHPGLAQ